MTEEESGNTKDRPRSRWRRLPGIAAALFIVLVILSAWWVKHNVYASPFSPTKLSQEEQQTLTAKLDRLERGVQKDGRSPGKGPDDKTGEGRLVPERYTEDPARREIRITERELNGIIAKDEETARRVAVHLSDDLVSVKVVMPIDPDFPILGGKTLRLNFGITLRHKAGKPVIALRGVSIGGVPLPNAWLGDLKNIDLVREFGDQGGFWDFLSKGVEDLKVSDGSLYVKLKE